MAVSAPLRAHDRLYCSRSVSEKTPGGEVFRSGCCWERGLGRIFYFRPGHETYPTYHKPEIQQVIANAVRWAAPRPGVSVPRRGRWAPLEPLGGGDGKGRAEEGGGGAG